MHRQLSTYIYLLNLDKSLAALQAIGRARMLPMFQTCETNTKLRGARCWTVSKGAASTQWRDGPGWRAGPAGS